MRSATYTGLIFLATMLLFVGCTKKSNELPSLTPLDGSSSAGTNGDSSKKPDASAPTAANSPIVPSGAPLMGATAPTDSGLSAGKSDVAITNTKHRRGHGKRHRRHGSRHHGRRHHHGRVARRHGKHHHHHA